jgi:hypothetical protein
LWERTLSSAMRNTSPGTIERTSCLGQRDHGVELAARHAG